MFFKSSCIFIPRVIFNFFSADWSSDYDYEIDLLKMGKKKRLLNYLLIK